MDVRLRDGPLLRWLHPKEGDILLHGTREGWAAVKTSKRWVRRGPSSPKPGKGSRRPPGTREMTPMSCWDPKVMVGLGGEM